LPIRARGLRDERRAAAAPIVRRVEFGGETWLHFPNIVPDVCILRATTADEWGNLTYEHEGAYLGGLEQAICTRNHGGLVIAQVKRVTARGSLRPHDVRVPGHLVDLIVVDPDQKQTCETPYDPAISGQIMRPWSALPWPSTASRRSSPAAPQWSLRTGMTANLGFGISAMVPRILLEEGHPEAVTWAIEQGAVGGMPLTGFAFGCASNADAFVPSPQQFIFFQGAGFDLAFLSFLEVDRGQRQRLEAGQETLPDGGLRRLCRHHRACAEDRVLRLVRGGRRGRADAAGPDRHAARQVHQDG
jgi:propionate CoA-transferase